MAAKSGSTAGQQDSNDVEDTTPARFAAPITLRLGELEDEVAARIGTGKATPGSIVKRDLIRYYALLKELRQRLHFRLPEAEAIVLALCMKPDTPARYIWAEVERQYLENAENEEHPQHDLPVDLDAAELVDRLRKLGPAQAHALKDAVEAYWAQSGPDEMWFDTVPERLVALGLTSAHSVQVTQAQRLKEKAQVDQERADGKLIVRAPRDPAARLRRRRQQEEEA